MTAPVSVERATVRRGTGQYAGLWQARHGHLDLGAYPDWEVAFTVANHTANAATNHAIHRLLHDIYHPQETPC